MGGLEDVDEWFAAQRHVMTPAARELSAAILRAVPAATTSIKWRAPNFALADDFATFSMRRPGVLQIILHTGAKPKPDLPAISVPDLDGRLAWAGHNRAIITFTSPDDLASALPPFEDLVRQWAAQAA